MKPLILRAEGLASKWGFGDGDMVSDYLYDLEDTGHTFTMPDRDKFLKLLIDKYLIPKLDDLDISYEIHEVGTIHNPVRAYKINGEEVDHYSPDIVPDSLKGIEVSISVDDILSLLKTNDL